jgi:hypothetical protein
MIEPAHNAVCKRPLYVAGDITCGWQQVHRRFYFLDVHCSLLVTERVCNCKALHEFVCSRSMVLL